MRVEWGRTWAHPSSQAADRSGAERAPISVRARRVPWIRDGAGSITRMSTIYQTAAPSFTWCTFQVARNTALHIQSDYCLKFTAASEVSNIQTGVSAHVRPAPVAGFHYGLWRMVLWKMSPNFRNFAGTSRPSKNMAQEIILIYERHQWFRGSHDNLSKLGPVPARLILACYTSLLSSNERTNRLKKYIY